MSSFFKENRNKLLMTAFVISVIAAVFILFGNSIPGGYTMDDHSVIEYRTELGSIKNIPKIMLLPWHYNAPWAGNYRSLTLISYVLNFFFSKSTIWLHVTDIILYGLNIILVYYLAACFVSKRIALFTATLFLFLPIHVEVVSSLVGRVYLLGSFFFFLSLIFYFKKRHVLSSVCFLLAVLSSDFAIALLPIIAVLLLYETRNFWKSLQLGFYYLPSAAIYFLLRYLALGKYAFGGFGFIDFVIGPLAYVSLKERILTGFLHFYLYLRKTIFPIDLSPDYSYNQVPIVHSLFSSYGAIIGILFLLAIFLIIIRGRRESKIAAIFFIFPFALMSNMIIVTTGTMGERWWYLPSFGIVLLVSIGIDKLIGKWQKLKTPVYLGGAVLFIWFSVLIFKQNRIWLNDRNLYLSAGEKSPMSVGARTNVAGIYFQEGDYEKTKEELKAAFKIYDKHVMAWNLWAKVQWREGDYQEAEDALKKAIDYDPHGANLRRLYRTLALLELDQGKNKEALVSIEKARQSPTSVIGAGDIELDNTIYKIIKKYENRTFNSYTEKEKKNLSLLIRAIIGF